MNSLIETFDNLAQQYIAFYWQFDMWLLPIMVCLIIAGAVVAFVNRDKHNFLVWILPVIVFPVFGALTAVVGAIVLAVLKKKNGVIPGKYFLNKGRVVFIAICTATAIFFVSYSKGRLPFINEAFAAGTAVLCLFLSYFATLRRYSREARFFHICRLSGQNLEKYNNDVEKNDYICHESFPDLLPSVEDVVKIKNSFFEGYAPRHKGSWQYVLNGANDQFVFDSYTEDEFRMRFDTETARYIGKGIVKITAYMWFWSDAYGVVVRNNHAEQPDIRADRTYSEYDGTSVRKVVLYRCQQSPKRLIVETLELAAAIFVFITPLGGWLHSIALSGLTSFWEMFFRSII